jgi:cytochrome c-type biogenesis protein CcmF
MYVPGTALMWMAFIFGVASTVTYGLAVKDPSKYRAIARQTYGLMTFAIVAASALLMYLIVTHDYRLSYVYAYSDNLLPVHYLISTFWGGQEGSFLLWIFCGVLLGLPLLRFARAYETRAMLVYNLTLLSLISLLLKQDPFRFHEGLTADFIPMDGAGLNPLLQNPWMVIHPPIMFVGYASLAIPFAFAIAALWMRRYDEWTKASMPWVLTSVVTLGTAIMMGGYWAYETLGWGGYWGWDPVENASLVPWLGTVALTHGMLLQRGRKRFRRLNLILAIASYLLVVYATFLTRSGVLSDFSVHSFVDLGISGWLVFNMLFFLLLGVGLLAYRWREIPGEAGEEPFMSRTVFFVLGVTVLILIGMVVLVGTSSPLITRLWMENPAVVGPDFYNGMGIYLAVVFALVLGTTPFLGWQKVRSEMTIRLVGVLAVVVGSLGGLAAVGATDPRAYIYLGAAVFCGVANVWAIVEKLQVGAWRKVGGEVSHVGIALMLLAFMTTGWFDAEQKVRLSQGEATQVLGYTMTFQGVEKPTPMSRDAMVVEVADRDGDTYTLKPRMWVNQKSNQLVANPDIHNFLTTDLYLAPVEYDPGEDQPVSGSFVLRENVPHAFRDWTLTFVGFDMENEHAISGAMAVGVVVELERPDHEMVILTPSLISTADGLSPVPVNIPATPGGRMRVTGLSVDSGQVRLELLGLGGGVGRQTVLNRGEKVAYKGYGITFADFDMSVFDPDNGRVDFGVVFDVEHEGTTTQVVPWFRGTGDGDTMVVPAAIPDSGGMSLSIGRVSAEDGAVQLKVFDPFLPPRPTKPASLVLDVSTKPLINLVWLGTLLVVFGVGLAITLRGRDVAAIPLDDA